MKRADLSEPPNLRYRLFLGLYGALMRLGQPLVWRYFRRRAQADAAYGAHLEERRGEGAPFDADIWVHAVSLGEMKSAEPLVTMCLEAGYRVVTTHATPAGRRAAEGVFAQAIEAGQLAVRYAPVDLASFWNSFFRSHRPQVGLVMEMEFWPAMIEVARRTECVLCLSNSQVPGKSYARAQRMARMFGHPVARAATVFAKSEPMADRFRMLGAKDVHVMGETRFDIAPPSGHVGAGAHLKDARSVLTLASVVAGEEEIYLNLVKGLLEDPAPPLIIWVPRAPELFEATVARLGAAGLNVVRRSDFFGDDLQPVASMDDVQVLVGNSLGEMFFYLSPADAVIVGGGFVEKGAHNVIEPLSLGKPVLTGPHVWTIEFPGVEAAAAGVLSVVPTSEELPDAVRRAMTEGGPAAKAFHGKNAGASRRIFDAVKQILEDTK